MTSWILLFPSVDIKNKQTKKKLEGSKEVMKHCMKWKNGRQRNEEMRAQI